MPSLLNPPPSVDPPRRSGTFRAAIILIGVFAAFLAVVFGVGLYQGFSRGRAIQTALPAVNNALKAPGVAEVRDAGCPYAMVMNASELTEMMAKLSGVAPPALGVSAGVFCFGPEELPDCAAVARAFVSSPGHVPGGFFVTIERRPAKERQVVCTRRYSDSGEDLGEFGPTTLPK